jgi:hypothetical protein
MLSNISQHLNNLLTELDKADTTASLTIATEHCEGVRNTLKSYSNSISVEMQNIQNELNVLVQKDRLLQEMFDHSLDLKLKDLPSARNIREQAKDQNDFETACLFLERSLSILQTGGDTNISISDIHGSQVNVAQGNITSQYAANLYNSRGGRL